MAITLTVEDGTIVANANTYVGVVAAKSYALDRGVTLGDSDDEVASLLIRSMDYFRQFDNKWKGYLVSQSQPLAFPRQGVILYDAGGYSGFDGTQDNFVNGWENFIPFGIGSFIPSNTIPKNLIDAQVQLAMAIKQGIIILPNVSGGSLPVVKEVIGPIETDYARPADMAGYNWYSVRLPAVTALLALLLRPTGGLQSVRV